MHFQESVLEHVISIVMIQDDTADVGVKRPLVIGYKPPERLVLRLRIQQSSYELLFFQFGRFMARCNGPTAQRCA